MWQVCQKFRIQEQVHKKAEKVAFLQYISSTKKILEQLKESKKFKKQWRPGVLKPALLTPKTWKEKKKKKKNETEG